MGENELPLGIEAGDAGGSAGGGGGRLPLRTYAKRIWPEKKVESSVKTLRRWQKIGREAVPPDPPPFDDLEKIAEWYERHHSWRASEDLTRFRDGVEEEAGESPGKEEVSAEPEADLPPMMLGEDSEEMTADLGLRQIRRLVIATYKQMELALQENKMAAYRSLLKEYSSQVSLLRQWEKDINKIQEGRGEVVRMRVINTELVQIFTTLGQSFFNGLQKVLADHAPKLPAEERRRIAIGMRDEVFLHLKKTRFEETWDPQS